MVELEQAPTTADCCSTEARATCCEPGDKAACCDEPTPAGSCGCPAGKSEPDLRETARERRAAQLG